MSTLGPSSPGLGLVVRAAARRDRVLVGAWLVVLVALVLASAGATSGLYATRADQVRAAEAIDASPTLVALYGPILDTGSLGELAMTKLTVLYAVAVAALGLVVVRRHTRAEEEDGRAELLAATGLGRATLLDGALAWATLTVVAAGLLAAASDVVGGLPVTGSVLFGASWTGVGLVGVGLAALAAQLTRTARATAALSLAIIGVWFALRAVADVEDAVGWLGWLSPLGWTTRLQAWSQPRWWVLGLWPALAVALVLAAEFVARRRDLGSGLVGERPGPPRGRLSGAASLAWRIQRATLLGWAVALGGTGALAAALAPGLGDLLDTGRGRDVLEALGGQGALEQALLGAILSFAGVGVCGWGIAVVARAAADEGAGRSELLLATGVPRSRAALTTVVMALLPPLALLALAGVVAAVVLSLSGSGATSSAQVLAMALVPWPATTVVVGVCLLAAAWWRRGAAVGWAVLALSLLLDDVGPLLHLPGVVLGLSPFHHVPAGARPGDLVGPSSLVLLLIGLTCAGLAARRFARRDLG